MTTKIYLCIRVEGLDSCALALPGHASSDVVFVVGAVVAAAVNKYKRNNFITIFRSRNDQLKLTIAAVEDIIALCEFIFMPIEPFIAVIFCIGLPPAANAFCVIA